MTFEQIEAIVRKLDGEGVDFADIRLGNARLRLRFAQKSPEHAPPPVISPSPGRFRSAHPLAERPHFVAGDRVRAGQTIAYVEANGLLQAVIAATELTLGRQLIEDGLTVGWGTALYETR